MGAYIDNQALFDEFGQTNIIQWADHDSVGDDTQIQASIDRAIEYAEQYVLDRMRQTRYAIPLVESESGGLRVIKSVMAKIAACRLYTARGLRDDAVEDRMQRVRNDADDTIGAYQSGQMHLAAAVKNNIVGAPAIIG